MLLSAANCSSPAVAEIQGLYGAFSFPEKLLQKIWWRGDFDPGAARTMDGRRVTVRHPGKWNLLGGPDFHGARLQFDDGPEIGGDIEVHLHAADWDAHGHARDPSYDRVVLHVVLFPPDERRATRGADGHPLPVLVLLPLLHHALEEFAAEEAIENLANYGLTRVPDELGALPAPELAELLGRHAESRWRQKVHFARLRIGRLGWAGACHHAALEILGYRFNRAPMLRLAGRWPLAQWASRALDPEEAFASESGNWRLQGVRPANHPRARLRQYAAWAQAGPGWPERWSAFAGGWPEVKAGDATREVRRMHRFVGRRAQAAVTLGAEMLGGTRFDNLLGDGLLPLLAAPHEEDFFGVWFHWYPGDLPPVLIRVLRQLGIFDGRSRAACLGAAQGLLGWLVEREARR